MANGNPNFAESKACPKGPPKGGVWFPVSVKVHDQEAQVYLDGDLVATIMSHFSLKARGGVFTFHGYKNVVLFRKFRIDPQIYVTKRCAKTAEFPGYVKLDADHGIWPQDGFCQVAYLKGCGSADYQISVDMYNFIGRDGVNFGHLGVFFNAEDVDNYDFVYFRFGIINNSLRKLILIGTLLAFPAVVFREVLLLKNDSLPARNFSFQPLS